MVVKIIQVSAAKLHLLGHIAPDVFDEAIDPVRVQTLVQQQNHALFVALDTAQQVVAQCLVMLHHHPDQPPTLYIDNLGVSPAYQRQGIARQLVAQCRQWGQAHNASVVWVATETDNDQGNDFYAALRMRRAAVHYFEDKLAATASPLLPA